MNQQQLESTSEINITRGLIAGLYILAVLGGYFLVQLNGAINQDKDFSAAVTSSNEASEVENLRRVSQTVGVIDIKKFNEVLFTAEITSLEVKESRQNTAFAVREKAIAIAQENLENKKNKINSSQYYLENSTIQQRLLSLQSEREDFINSIKKERQILEAKSKEILVIAIEKASIERPNMIFVFSADASYKLPTAERVSWPLQVVDITDIAIKIAKGL